jgi:heterodisulfide reductase subunit C2
VGHAPHAHGHGPEPLADRVHRMTGSNPRKCYQCGKCSAGCPMAEETTLRPHDVMRMVARGDMDRLADADGMWLCLTCETCTSRCPNGCDPAATMDALREIAAAERPGHAPKPIAAFHRSFLDQVRSHGRLFEMGLILAFKTRGGPLFADVDAAPAMLSRGKLHFAPTRVKGLDDVRRIFAACAAEGEGHHE